MADTRGELWVWMNGEQVGIWHRGRNGTHRFTYQAAWLDSPHVRPLSLSLSLPITPDRTISGGVVAHYFDNLLPGGRHRMMPLYDVLSLWPVVGKGANQVPWPSDKLAMAVRSRNVHYTLHSIQPRHWQGLATRAGVDGVWEDMLALVERAEAAVAAVQAKLPAGFPARTARAVFDGVCAQARLWRQGLAATLPARSSPRVQGPSR